MLKNQDLKLQNKCLWMNSKMKKFLFTLIILSLSIFVSCQEDSKLPKKDLTITRTDGSQITLNVEIAKTPETRQFGYMERKTIPDGTGMIFVFESDQILSFYMKNTPHPLSIAYIDSTGKIRDIFDMKPFSLDTIFSTCSVRYALEVPQGWYEKNLIKKGDFINLPSSW